MTATEPAVDPHVEASGYRLFDADNHCYEETDAFTRYQDPTRRDEGARWVTADDSMPCLPMAPIDYFRRNVWANPYDTEDLLAPKEAIGIARMLFGSDYPHADAHLRPTDFLDAMTEWSDDDQHKIVHDNAREFVSVA